MHRPQFAFGPFPLVIAMAFFAMIPAVGTLAQQFQDQTATRFPPSPGDYSNSVTIGDIDGDGDLDIIFANGGGYSSATAPQILRIYINNGTGIFTDESVARTGGLSYRARGVVVQPMDIIFGDIDGDFDLDLRIASRGSNGSKLWRNNGMGVFTNVTVSVADQTCYSYDFGDMDGDGDLDLLGINAGPSSTELLLANNGAGTYTNASSQLLSNPSIDDNDSKFFDYDNDGDLDIIIGSLGSTERIYN